MRVGEIRLQGDGLLIMSKGFVQSPEYRQRDSQIAVCHGQIGFYGDGLLIAADSFIGQLQRL